MLQYTGKQNLLGHQKIWYEHQPTKNDFPWTDSVVTTDLSIKATDRKNRFRSVEARTKYSVGPTDFVYRCTSIRIIKP
jgi:hypothetical protein